MLSALPRYIYCKLRFDLSTQPALLTFSSYNSAVFGVVSGQDYTITAIRKANEPLAHNTQWKTLSNPQWTHIYSYEYVSGFSDLLLVLNNASATVRVNSDWSYSLESPTSASCSWNPIYETDDISISFGFNLSTRKIVPVLHDENRIIFALDDANTFGLDPQWPKFDQVNVNNTYRRSLSLCPDSGWLAEPSKSSLHVEYAHAKVRPYASKVQIALPFLVIVLAANIFKTVGIFYTLRLCSSGHIITVGDAVATFLRFPEASTKGKCTLTQRELLESIHEMLPPHPWYVKRKQIKSTIGGKRAWTTIIL